MGGTTMKSHGFAEFSSGHVFLEAPRWHDGKLWLSDFFRRHVIAVAPDGAVETVVDVPNSPSGLGFLSDGSVLIVSRYDHKLLRLTPDGALTVHADLAPFCGGDANDMLVIKSGHAYVGNFGFDLAGGAEPTTTHLLHVTPDGEVTAVPGDVSFPNGVAQAGTTIFLAETLAQRISAFDLQLDGTLTNYREWASLPETHNPDGITVDSDGGVWYGNALTEGPEAGFYRVEEGGTVTDSILIDDGWGVACTFGGPNNDVLYLVTNDTNLPDFSHEKSKGYVRTASVGRRGAN
ncbi:MAG: SMP-30/gluconolactonase/LRE family protein [Mycobacterium sp.]